MKDVVECCVNDDTATLSGTTLTFSSSVGQLAAVSYSTGSSRSHISDVFPTATDLENGYMTLSPPSSADWIHAIFANNYGKTIVEIEL